MKKVIVSAVVLMLGAVGCQSNKKSADASLNGGVTDLASAPAPAVTYQPAPAPVAPAPVAQPVAYDQPMAPANGSMSGGTYTVRRGDTLFSIAKRNYGDGKQYTKIMAANPGVEPSKLKVGQTLVLP